MFVTSLHILWIRVGVILEDLAGKVLRNVFKRLLAAPSPRVHDAKNKRLVIYTENYLVGGLDKFLGDLLDGSHERPVLFYNAGNTSIPRIAHIRGLQSIALPIKQAGVSHNAIGRMILMFTRRFLFVENYWTILKAFSDADAARVLVVNGGYPGADSCRAAIIAGARVGARSNVMSVLSSPTFYPVSGSTSPAGILQRVIHSIDWVIDDLMKTAATAIHVNCTPARDEMVSFMNFHPAQVHVIPTGINLPAIMGPLSGIWYLNKHNGETWVGMVGRLDPLKGQEYLLRAFEFLKWDKRIHCLIVGGGPDLRRLWKIKQDLDLDDQVSIIGNYEGDINDIYRFLDIFMFSSLHEGLPYVVEEAMAHGLPVIATRIGGVPDLLEDNVNGILVPAASPRAIADAILHIIGLGEEALWLMKKRARETIEKKFTTGKMMEGLEALFK
jgi:glycosyltransferase involved in cell wall biosynthesis